MKYTVLSILLVFSVSHLMGQHITVHSDSAQSVEFKSSTEVSLGIDVGYFTIAGFLPMVVDIDFDKRLSTQIGFGPTINDGLVALFFSNAFSGGSREIDHKFGLGGYGRVKYYLGEQQDRKGRWNPYFAAGYEYTVWNREWVNSNGNFAYRGEQNSLSAVQVLLGFRKQYRSDFFVDFTLGVSRAVAELEETNLSIGTVEVTNTRYTLPAANLVLGFYLD